MVWLLVALLASCFALPAYAGMRYQRPAVPHSTALLAAALIFGAVASLSAFSTWSSTIPWNTGEWE